MKGFVRPWHTLLLISGLWLLLVLVSLFSRHLLVIDETRYISVAWEMWVRGDWLVPYLNGEPYHHKPPLLFWLVNLGWKLFGVSESVARLVPAGAGLAGVFLAALLAGKLWPKRDELKIIAAWVLSTTLLWTLWTTALMFDLLVAVCAQVALLGILLAWRGRAVTGWLVTGLGIGLGVLAKGPVILVYVLPAAIFAPWWMTEQRPRSWIAWFGGLSAAILLGAAIGLSWALSAAAAGGADYANHLLWGQTTNRVVASFAHRRPLWWYLPLLPVIFFPWSLWPPLWRAVKTRWREGWDSGERFTLTIAISGLVTLSLISGKQLHYMLPLFPALALFAARVMGGASDQRPVKTWAIWLPVAPLMLLGLTLASLPYLVDPDAHPTWIESISPWAGTAVVAVMFLAVMVVRKVQVTVWPGVVLLLFFFSSYPGIVREVAANYDVTAIGKLIGELQRAGHQIAVVEHYQGEFNFPGRLARPVAEIDNRLLPSWKDKHPDGVIAERTRKPPRPDDTGVLFVQPYRSSYLVLHNASLARERSEGLE